LISATPADELQIALEDLKRTTEVSNGHRIPPMPAELYWAVGSQINSKTMYALTRQVVQMELKKFAQRLDRYYHLVPKTK